jgi:hypothetical protein
MAGQLMDRILNDPYIRDQNGHFRRCGRRTSRGVDDVARIRRFIRLLVRQDSADQKRIGLARSGRRYRASGAIFRNGTTYEDVFALCQQIDYWMHGLSDNALTTPFLELLERRAGTIVDGQRRSARMVALGQLAIATSRFIQVVVADALRSTNVVGFDLLLELIAAPDIEQVNIVTLNHDTLVEQLLARAGIPVVDGFGDPDGDVRWYDDARYDDANARIRLIKLHGSIDWYTFVRGPRRVPAILLRGTAAEAADAAGQALEAASPYPSFLSGGEKEAFYQHGIYADLHLRFHQLLRECHLMIMSGYGWGDTGITNQIDWWLEQRPTNRLVLLHRRPEEIRDRSPLVMMSYDDLVQRGQLVLVERWLCDTSLPSLRPVLRPPIEATS